MIARIRVDSLTLFAVEIALSCSIMDAGSLTDTACLGSSFRDRVLSAARSMSYSSVKEKFAFRANFT